ncbi:MAG: HAD family hydrolase [Clostridia bacterium]|nr:HAD family hydrolase [Clostridia bacterium]
MIKALIFDLDGTLADTIDDIGWSVNRMLSSHGFPTLEREDHIAHINNGAFQLIRRSLPEDMREDVEFIRSSLAEYEAEYSGHYIVATSLYPGIKDILSKLHRMGIKLSVLSNKQDRYVKDIIKALLPEIPFCSVQGQGELPTKPDPTSALTIAQAMRISPREIAFVGDSPVDIQTARNAGMLPVGVSWGYRPRAQLIAEGAFLTVDSAEELIRVLAP